jgi:hypothetical protein
MGNTKILESPLISVEKQCKLSLDYFSFLVKTFLKEAGISKASCMEAVNQTWENQGRDELAKDTQQLTLHIGMVIITIASAREALKNKQLDLCIRLLTTVALEYGFAYTYLDKKIAIKKRNKANGYTRTIKNEEAARKRLAIIEIKKEVFNNLDKFAQHGYTKKFNYEMSEKYSFLSIKTIEKHVAQAKKR